MSSSEYHDNYRRPRVAVTGVGAVTALGVGVEPLWSGLVEGRSGVRRITRFDPTGLQCHVAAEVPDEPDVPDRIGPYEVYGGPYKYMVSAAMEALAMAGVDDSNVPPRRRSVYISGGATDLLFEVIGELIHQSVEGGVARDGLTADDLLPRIPDEPLIGHLDHFCGGLLPGILATLARARSAMVLSTACAGGSQAIGNAVRQIREGSADLVLAGGCDALVSRQIVSGFDKLNALTRHNEEPATASRPFEATRNGFVLGEAAGMLVLESLASARRRGAPVLAELAGVGLSDDAYRLTDPHPDGIGMALSMRRALDDAGLAPAAVDYINAHGTSTQMNDKAETKAIRDLLGPHADEIVVSSSKSMVGHPIHGAGAVETVICVRSLQEQVVHPTINYREPDPDCDLDYVPNEARERPISVALNNSFGFGGQNTTLLVKRAE